MRIVFSLVICAIMLALPTLAATDVLSVKTYNREAHLIDRDYLLEGDRITLRIRSTEPIGTQKMMLTGVRDYSCGCVKTGTITYTCTYTVLSPGEMQGPYDLLVNDVDTGITYEMNPEPVIEASSVTDQIVTSQGGTITYFSKMSFATDHSKAGEVAYYLYVKNTYSSSLGTCPYGNALSRTYLKYSLDGGNTWKSLSSKEKLIGKESVDLTFKVKVPNPCIGTFDIRDSVIVRTELVD